MASFLYDKGRNRFARGEVAWKSSGGDTIRVCLVKSAYTPTQATDEFFSDLGASVVGGGGSGRADCPALTLADPAAGVCDAADATLTAANSGGSACNAIVVFKDGGSDGASPLLAYIDNATGLPLTPSGGNVNIIWDSGANRIFKL